MDRRQIAMTAAAIAAAGIVCAAAWDVPPHLSDPVPMVETFVRPLSPRTLPFRADGPVPHPHIFPSPFRQFLRALMVIPCWCGGCAVIAGMFALYGRGMSAGIFPVICGGMLFLLMARALGWTALLILAAVVWCTALRLAVPTAMECDIRGLRLLARGIGLLALMDGILFMLWRRDIAWWIWELAATGLVTGVCVWGIWERYRTLARRRGKRSASLTREEIEQIARALADSVCPRRYDSIPVRTPRRVS